MGLIHPKRPDLVVEGRTYKTGMRVPVTGVYVDQYGVTTHHEQHKTFPPCVDRKGECAHRQLVVERKRSA